MVDWEEVNKNKIKRLESKIDNSFPLTEEELCYFIFFSDNPLMRVLALENFLFDNPKS